MFALPEPIGFGCVAVHGFRSTSKDWTNEAADLPDDL